MVTKRYSSEEFFGVMINTKTSKYSTIDYGQYLAYNAINKQLINNFTAGIVYATFGIESISFIESIVICISIDQVKFHIVKADTSFLLCIVDLDRLKCYLNNVNNVLIKKDNSTMPVICWFEYSFLLWDDVLHVCIIVSFNNNPCFFIERELRRLHKQFGHSFAERLRYFLERSRHEVNKHLFEKFSRYCIFCQKHNKSLERFKFILRNNVHFNFIILIDIMYINNSSILHVINEATRFQAVK